MATGGMKDMVRQAWLWFGLVGGAAMALTGAGPAAAQSLSPLPAITVEGEASAEVVPDMAQLSIGVAAERPTAGAATAEVAKAAQAVVAEIKAQGIADTDVATAAVALAPVDPDAAPGRRGGPQPLRSFRASTDLVIAVRPAERAGAIASDLVDKGANTIDGVAYASSEAPQVLDRLRGEAMTDARHKAELYVGALGLKLGRVMEITPSAGGVEPQGMMRKAMVAAAPAPSLPVKAGTLSVRAAVSVRWEILQ